MIRYLKYSCLLIGFALLAIAAVRQHERAQNKCESEWIYSEDSGKTVDSESVSASTTAPTSQSSQDMDVCLDPPSSTGNAEALINEPHLLILNLFFWL